MKFHVWRVAIQTDKHDYVGTPVGEFTDKVKRQAMTPDSLLWKVKGNKDIFTFKFFIHLSLANHTFRRWYNRNSINGFKIP